jgi:6-pyruvoyltetrahydropterin/6-carboxytetrahydropterin synthase
MTVYYTRVSKRYHFESAHFLPKVHAEHKCRRVHGHNYKIEISVASYNYSIVEGNGFVIDFWDLDKIVQPIIDTIDHRCLNDIKGLENPTAERIALWFMLRLQHELDTDFRCTRVIVWETDDCYATVLAQ